MKNFYKYLFYAAKAYDKKIVNICLTESNSYDDDDCP